MLCEHESGVYGAMPCPREAGHRGDHFWVLKWEFGGVDGWGCPDDWRVLVFSGTPYDRRLRCRGRFTAEPELADVNFLLVALVAAHERQERMRRRALEELTRMIVEPASKPRRGVNMRRDHSPPPAAESAATRAARAASRGAAHGAL